jgi:hypothetical protein
MQKQMQTFLELKKFSELEHSTDNCSKFYKLTNILLD